MKVSLNTIKQYIDFELPPVDELVQRINGQLGGVEEVIDLSAKYKDAVIAKVVKCERHPNADKLSVCEIDAGTGENIQVVCGAPNVREGLFVVWLPPGSTVPASFDDKEPFVLEPKELRGVVSHGMLASARELAIGDSHDGIVEITEYDVHQGNQLVPGQKFAEVFGLDDTIIDIENKMFTHRPDLFGQLGVAREISAILLGPSDKDLKDEDTRFVNPDWYWSMPEFDNTPNGLELAVFNDIPEKTPRFMAVAMEDIQVKPSPLWLQIELVRWGGKPINNIVDLTNYMMLLTAQPTHAYDYDKLRGHKLGARMAKKGERAKLLNGKTYELDETDIVIADGEGVVGLAGIMGGGESEVSSETTNIVLEVANFDMYTVRRSSMKHGLFTDALTRFNKGQSPLQNDRVLKQLMEFIPGKQASPVFDLPDTSNELHEVSVHGEVIVGIDFINERLGVQLSEAHIGSMLRRVNFAVYPTEDDKSKLSITAPYWRTDIELPEDVVEEVGRLYGFDKLPRELPQRSMKPAAKNDLAELKHRIRESLSRAGANEVLTYSFVHENVITRAEQDVSQAFRLANALSPDLQYYRLSLVPSLLDKVHANIKAGHDEFLVFEVGKAHGKSEIGNDGLPVEFDRIAGVYASKQLSGAPYYTARRYVDKMTANTAEFVPLADADISNHELAQQMVAPFVPRRSAAVMIDGQMAGVIGEFKPSVAQAFKLPVAAAGFELYLSALLTIGQSPYESLSRYPSVTQDISLKVDVGVNYQQLALSLEEALEQAAGKTHINVWPLSIYQAENDSSVKTISFRIEAVSYENTLTDKEVSAILKQAADKMHEEYNAILV